MSDRTTTIPVLWFNSTGSGPDEMALELRPFKSEKGGAIPATLGVQVRVAGLVIVGIDMVDGGFYLHRDQVAELHRQLGEWLEANPVTR